MSFENIRKSLNNKRKTINSLDKEYLKTKETLRTIEVRKLRLVRLGLDKSREFQMLSRKAASLKRKLPQLKNKLTESRAAAEDLFVEFAQFEPPQQAVENLDDRIPFLLLPVRLETRFKTIPSSRSGDKNQELWLRIYPDDIHVDTHEDTLTEDEVNAAQVYWTEIWKAGGDKAQELGAWRVLIAKYGPQRASWIVNTYKPNNEINENGLSNRPAEPVSEDEELDPAPAFDPYEARLESWSRAPRVTTMPDRFVAIGYQGGKKIFEHIGNPIPDPLIVGPDPSLSQEEGFRRKEDELEVDLGMKWMFDFDEAVRVGMGMKIPLKKNFTGVFSKILVLGLRLSSNEEESRELVESLIESHHYSEDGFSLIPQGIATNNTRSGGCGFKSFELGDDESYDVELQSPLFTPELNWKNKKDGQYLSEALGINPEVLQHIQFSDGFDQRDARAMNTALWPATLGYFLEEMMDPLFSPETIEELHDFFVRYVSGRGAVPSIRVGNMPYGILPATAFSLWKYKEHDAGGITGDRISTLFPVSRMEKDLFEFLKRLDKKWSELAQEVSYAGKAGDSQKNLLDILGLHAGSAEYYHRFAVSLEQLSNMLKMKQITWADVDLEAYFRSVWTDTLNEFGADTGEIPEIYKRIFYKTHTILNGPLVDNKPLSDTEKVQAISQDDENYIEWLATSPIDTIRRQDFGRKEGQKISPPRSLLYLMLRHSVMNAFWDSAWCFFKMAEVVSLPSRKEPAFLYIRDENPGESKFSLLYKPAAELHNRFPTVFKNRELTVAEQISEPNVIQIRPETRALREVRAALECLRDRPTNVLARAFSEHVDLCSYRLDSWLYGLVNQRLFKLRGEGDSIRLGIYLGAFGWLENVKPEQVLSPYEGKVPEEFVNAGSPPLQTAAENAGYIHGPSLNHAVTAAVLRNAYVTHADRDHSDVTAVNLTSERVRSALFIIEGIQNGQEMGALLGYQFERGLHDRYQQAEVDKFIFPLRKKFPLVANRLHKSDENNPSEPNANIEVVEARNVIDGLALVRHVQTSGKREYPFGLSGLPDATDNESKAINSEVDRMENTLDAVSDLMTAESIYQVVQGNYDRSGAALDSVSFADNIPDPEIIKTPRSGHILTHRTCLLLETNIPVAEKNPFNEIDIPLSPRAAAEPGINKWLATFFGNDPEKPVIQVVHVEQGAGADGADIEHPYTISLKDLKIQPIDLIYVLNENLKQDQSELDELIVYTLKKKGNLSKDAVVRIEYTAAVDGKVTFFQFMPLFKVMKALIIDSRALNAQDMVLPSDQTQDLSQNSEPDQNPSEWDVNEIKTRVEAVKNGIISLKNALQADLTILEGGLPTANQFNSIHNHLFEAGCFSIPHSIPEFVAEKTQDAADALKSRIQSVVEHIEERLISYNSISIPNDLSPDDKVSRWIDAGQSIFGSEFTWTSAFKFKLPDEIRKAHSDSGHILRFIKATSEYPVDEWLHGLARVRPKMNNIEACILLANNFNTTEPVITPIQLPYKADDYWLGLTYPAAYDFDGDRLLLSCIFPENFDPDKSQSGIFIDEWTEVVPTKEETTGVAFHYDAPNSEPPQALLLAVTPEITGKWKWDHLVATLGETLDMAKKRVVEPQQIDESKYVHFLPSIMVPATRYLITIATNLLVNVGKMDAIVDIPPEGGSG
ncbi:MAG: hypothetical protein JXB26_19295 [Candidatus Aminicenantes bacterium]|nr:hypothetical protein [Candidatus Aminicenantes bacterium]